MFPSRPAHKTLLAVFFIATLGGCRGCEEPEEPAAPEAPPAEAPRDQTPPTSEGLTRLALIGERTWRAEWSAASDDVSAPETLIYEIHHARPGRRPDPEGEAVHRSEAGALHAIFTWEGEAGRFHLRALDEAGNASDFCPGLFTAAQMPWERLPDGGDASPLARCLTGGDAWPEGRALCLSTQGRPLFWKGDRWQRVQGVDGESFRMGRTTRGLTLADERGRLWIIDANGEATSLEVRWEGARPRMPLRALIHDPLGLDYALDSRGRVWVGELPRMLAMQRPLALPQAGRCTELRMKLFAGPEGYALCADGRVYIARTDAPILRWTPLFADVAEGLADEITAWAAEERERVLLVAGERAWRLGGDGWTSLEAPENAAIRDVTAHGGEYRFASASGLLQLRGDRLVPLRGAEGDLGAAVPAGDEGLHLLHRDGAVAGFTRGRSTWIVPPPIGDLRAVGGDSLGNRIILALRPAPSIQRWRNGAWQELMRAPSTEGMHVEGVAADGSRAWIAGYRGDEGVLLRGDAGRWSAEPFRVDRLLLEELVLRAELELPRSLSRLSPEEGASAWQAQDALPPLEGPPLSQLGGLLAVEPLRGVEVSGDGRGIAWGDYQVWMRGREGWYLIHRSDERLTGALLDAGQAWISLGESRIRRCIRTRCGDSVPQLATTPDSRPRLVRMGGMGAREVVTTSGSTWRFDAAFASPEELADIPLHWPMGEFVQELPPREGRDILLDRLVHEGADVIVNEEGELLLAIEGQRISQGKLPDLIALWPLDEGWGALTRDGLLRPVPPAPATR